MEKNILVAYKLALPPSLSKMHDIFHVFLLQKYVANASHVFNFSNLQMLEPHSIEVLPIRILTFRTRKQRNRKINECLVQWDKYSESSSTWEDIATMKR